MTSASFRESVTIDGVSNLPIPPFGLLFSRSERAVMTVLYVAQLSGHFPTSHIKLATLDESISLPGPYKMEFLDDDK